MEKMPRNTSAHERAALKTATRHSLKRAVASKFSLVTRVQPPALSDYASMAASEFMPIDIVLDLEHEFPEGTPSPLLSTLAELAGFKLVPIEGGEDGASVNHDDVGRLIKEGGEAKAATLRAVGATDLNTVRAARRESDEARDAYAANSLKLARQERRIMARAAP